MSLLLLDLLELDRLVTNKDTLHCQLCSFERKDQEAYLSTVWFGFSPSPDFCSKKA